ncbi:hypothetical protein IKZ70_02055 [bacterium]|nr:hypothetical protein [bacterium]
MKKVLILLAAVCVVSAMAENTVLHVIDFETSEGYSAGELLGQNGWYSIYSANGRQQVVNDPTTAPSGSQYATFTEDSNGPNSAVKFDISEDYVPGCKLLISWDQAGSTAQNGYIKLHNAGDTGKNYDIEIAEIIMYKPSNTYAAITVSKKDKSGTLTKGVDVGDTTAFHHFTLLIDPATRCIKEYTVDGNVIDDITDTYYKNECDGKARGGDLIDGVRFMNKGSFDNFKVEMLPEPAIFGLLALAGLFFVRKQR